MWGILVMLVLQQWVQICAVGTERYLELKAEQMERL